MLVIVVMIVVPSYLVAAANQLQLRHGRPGRRFPRRADAAAIERRFGKENALVLLVPRGDVGRRGVS
jgi:hypothetical protein